MYLQMNVNLQYYYYSWCTDYNTVQGIIGIKFLQEFSFCQLNQKSHLMTGVSLLS
jgi:hypothetical protein